MPYQIVPKEYLAEHIFEVVNRLNEGVLKLRERGIYAEMPVEVSFQVLFIDKPQALAITTTVNRNGKVNQGGTNTVKETGTEGTVSLGTTSQIPNRVTSTEENGNQNTAGQTADISQQETQHGETVETTYTEDTSYYAGSSDTGFPDPLPTP